MLPYILLSRQKHWEKEIQTSCKLQGNTASTWLNTPCCLFLSFNRLQEGVKVLLQLPLLLPLIPGCSTSREPGVVGWMISSLALPWTWTPPAAPIPPTNWTCKQMYVGLQLVCCWELWISIHTQCSFTVEVHNWSFKIYQLTNWMTNTNL